MTRRLLSTAVCLVGMLAVGICAAAASAASLAGCASGAVSGQVTYTVSVSATGKPFVTMYVASPPTAGGSAGCAAPVRSAAPSVTLNGPGIALYPLSPHTLYPLSPDGAALPMNVYMLPVGPSMLMVPHNPSTQVYQIAPGHYVVRSLDPSGNTTVVTPLPPSPQAPNAGPIPSVLH